MRRMLNGILGLIGLVVVLAVYFLLPVGRYTLFEHTLRIAATEPAQELGEDLSETTVELGQRAQDEWDSRSEERAQAIQPGADASEADAPETGAPETDAPETDAPRSQAPSDDTLTNPPSD